MNSTTALRASDTMRVLPRDIEALLSEHCRISDEALMRAKLVRKETGERLEAIVTRLGLISEAAIASALAAETGLAQVTPSDFPQEPVGATLLSAPFLHEMRAVPILLDSNSVIVAQADPLDSFVAEAMYFVFGVSVHSVVALPSDIDAAVERLYARGQTSSDADAMGVDEDDLERLKDIVSDAPVIRAVNRLIAEAVDIQASDIHIEPTEDALKVRFRIDGVLRERPTLPAALRAPFVSRIKVMSGLNIAERRLPQDGRLRLAVRGKDVDLRVATSPSIHGETVVMRILDRSNLSLNFTTLGFDQALATDLRKALHRPHGIVLVTGPTGSGKTTTLYAALAELNERGRKLLTVEDPIEYRLPGVVQTQVNPAIGFGFSTALRSFLRQDPDVMMVGEIRDSETAKIAVQAALTGHVILSTLHTNTAAGAITRLLDMEVEPFLLSSVINAVLAQRLVRRICPHCKEAYEPDADVIVSLGVEYSPDLTEVFYQARGCDACNGTGYSGRVALIELLTVDEEIARLILHNTDTREIAKTAEQAGMRTLMSDGLAKVRAGLTTVSEVLRVANEG